MDPAVKGFSHNSFHLIICVNYNTKYNNIVKLCLKVNGMKLVEIYYNNNKVRIIIKIT